MVDVAPLQAERARMSSAYLNAQNDYKNCSFGNCKKRKKIMNELEDQLKRIDRSIEDIIKKNNDTVLANQGIDARGNRVNAVTGSVNTLFNATASVVSSMYSPGGGKFGQGAAQIAQASNDALAIRQNVTPPTVAKSKNTMFIIAGAVLVLFLFMKKK